MWTVRLLFQTLHGYIQFFCRLAIQAQRAIGAVLMYLEWTVSLDSPCLDVAVMGTFRQKLNGDFFAYSISTHQYA